MAKPLTSFRLSQENLDWLKETASALDMTQAALLDDALTLLAHTNNAASANVGSLWKEIALRYGDDAEILTWVAEDEGGPIARVRVNGQEPLDVRGHVTIDHERGLAHLFLELDGWSIVRYGSTYVGSKMVATLPIYATATFTWPADPQQPTAVVGIVGDIIKGGARTREAAEN